MYIEYQSVCPFVGIESHIPPPPQARVSSPLDPKGGEQHTVAGEGVVGPNIGRINVQKAWHSVYCVVGNEMGGASGKKRVNNLIKEETGHHQEHKN